MYSQRKGKCHIKVVVVGVVVTKAPFRDMLEQRAICRMTGSCQPEAADR